jgi:hypothetical protein
VGKHHTVHNDTFVIGVEWAILGLRHNDLLPGLRAAMVLNRYPSSGLIPRSQLVQDYREVFGLSVDTAYRDLRSALTEHAVDGMAIQFIQEVQHEKRGKVLFRNSYRWLGERNQITHLGLVTLHRAAIERLETFRVALYEAVIMAFAAYQGDDGWWTISRQGITKILGVAESTQKRYDLALKVEVRENLTVPADEDYAGYPACRIKQDVDLGVPSRRAIQIRNSYRAHGRFVMRVRLSKELDERRRANQGKEERRVPAERFAEIRPERGDRVAKQSFTAGSVVNGMDLPARVVIDVGVGVPDEHLSHPARRTYRNAPTTRRYHVRYRPGQSITYRPLFNFRDGFDEPTCYASAFDDMPSGRR